MALHRADYTGHCLCVDSERKYQGQDSKTKAICPWNSWKGELQPLLLKDAGRASALLHFKQTQREENLPSCLKCPVASWNLLLASTEELKRNFLKG